MDADRVQAVRILLTGLSVGDCLGVPAEFTPREAMPSKYAALKATGWPERLIGGGPFGLRPGQGSDDTDMAMCLVRACVNHGGEFDPDAGAAELAAWLKSGPPDVGGTTRRVLGRIAQGVPWHEAAYAEYQRSPFNAPNGSVIRNGAFLGFAESTDQILEWSVTQSMLTHYAPMPCLCCAVHGYLLGRLLCGEWPLERAWLKAWRREFSAWLARTDNSRVHQWRERVEKDGRLADATNELCAADFSLDTFNPYTARIIAGGGAALITLQIAVWALGMSRWPVRAELPFAVPAGLPAAVFRKRGASVLSWVALIGLDSDSYSAAAGGLVAAANEGKFPPEMTDGLEVLPIYDALVRGGPRLAG